MEENQKIHLEVVINGLKCILENNKENDVIKIPKIVVENIIERLEIVTSIIYCKNCIHKGKSLAFSGMIYCKLYRIYKFPDEYCNLGEKEKEKEDENETD